MTSIPDRPELSHHEKNLAVQKIKAREIVNEIIQFGVTNVQILYIIRLLALELEDVNLMHALTDIINQAGQISAEGTSSDNSPSGKTKIYT
jgi:hypothetical protein|tara:strand:+ start:1842 stop:2114 length:273 start_codon:yes stop_codon:yes gene_type:complete